MPPPRILTFLRTRILKTYTGHPFRLFTTALKSLFLYHVIITHFYSIQATMGASMLPTLTAFGDSVLISQHYRRGRDVRVGDVVAFGSVVQDGERVIKRVVGMEGDFVGLGEGGKMLQVPKGHCWVVGDNMPYSRDSRHFGPLPMALIKGKVIAKVFPWSERGWIANGLNPVKAS